MQSLYDDRNFPATLSPPRQEHYHGTARPRRSPERLDRHRAGRPRPPRRQRNPGAGASRRAPRRSSSTASAAANCPVRPTANWSTSFPSSGPKGASCSRAPRTAATTIRWVACTEATPRRCWTPAWAARSIPGSRPARAIPPPTCGSLPARADRQGRPGARRRPVVHLGRSTAVAEGRLYDVDDRLYAVGSTTCLVLHMAG